MDDSGQMFPVVNPLFSAILSDGMTRRQWLTGLAMQGMLSNPESWNLSAEKIAEYAYKLADAILAYETKLNDT